MKKPSPRLEEICIQIGLYFLEYQREGYVMTTGFIHDLCISDIQETDDVITITTARPGLLIGRKGVHFDGLTARLKKKIQIVESFCWADFIAPRDYMTEMAMEDEMNTYQDFGHFL